MNYTITFTAESLNVVLQHLDAGSHKVVRPIIDDIIKQAQAAANQTPEQVEQAEVAESSGLTD